MTNDTRALMRDAAHGAIGGVVGTTVMTAGMWFAQRAGLLGEMPPKKVVRKIASRMNAPPHPHRDRALAALLHYAIGGGAAVLYGLVRRSRPAQVAPGASGMGFGMLVWATGYLGLLPAAHIVPMPADDRPGRPTTMILAHLLYGYVVGRTVRALARPQVQVSAPPVQNI